jgi:gliding motility-associated lipoprotein GldH
MLLFTACGPEILYQDTKSINGNEWRYEEVLEYSFKVNDTTSLYKMVLRLNHIPSFSYENIYLNIGTEFPVLPPTKQVVSINLLDANGIWEGTCKGNDCLKEVLMQNSFSFPEIGNYTVTVSQWSREEALPGIKSIQLSIIKEE